MHFIERCFRSNEIENYFKNIAYKIIQNQYL